MSQDRQVAIDDIGRAMQRYQRSVQAFDDAVGRQLGLGLADMRCLDFLSEAPRTAGELAVAAGLRPAATTALIDRLERKGFVQRRPSPDDRRRVMVELTNSGSAQVWAAYGPMVEEGQRLFDSHTVDELEAMAALLGEMTSLTERHREQLRSRASRQGSVVSNSSL